MPWIKSNLVGLISFAVVFLTALQGLKDFGLVNDLQLAAITVSSFVVIIVPLVKTRWAGALKTGLDLVFAGITILIPFAALWLTGAPLTKDAIVLMLIAFAKALATEFGVQIRTDWGATSPKALLANPASVPLANPVTENQISTPPDSALIAPFGGAHAASSPPPEIQPPVG